MNTESILLIFIAGFALGVIITAWIVHNGNTHDKIDAAEVSIRTHVTNAVDELHEKFQDLRASLSRRPETPSAPDAGRVATTVLPAGAIPPESSATPAPTPPIVAG